MTDKTLYLIRHTAPRIAAGICYGQLNLDVSDSFIEEAGRVSSLLPPLELIITSPLRRTQRLAHHLAQEHHCALHSDTRLMEMHFGDWEGRAWHDIARSEIDAWSSDTLHYTPPNGESAQQMMLRVHSLLQALAQLPQQHIALVAHGGSIRAVLAQLADIPLLQTLNWQIDYGAVISLRLAFDTAKFSPTHPPRQT